MRDAHITYIDEENQQQKGWYEIVELTSGYITFLTGKNKITIPMSRVLRVKERGEESE